MRLILINDWLTWCGYQGSIHYLASDVILTESPAILESNESPNKKIDISEFIDQELAINIALNGLEVSNKWQAVLDKWGTKHEFEVNLGKALGRSLPHMVISAVYKWRLLTELLTRYNNDEEIVVPVLRGDSWLNTIGKALQDPRGAWYEAYVMSSDLSRISIITIEKTRKEIKVSHVIEARVKKRVQMTTIILRGLYWIRNLWIRRSVIFNRLFFGIVGPLGSVTRVPVKRVFLFLPNDMLYQSLLMLPTFTYKFFHFPRKLEITRNMCDIMDLNGLGDDLLKVASSSEHHIPLLVCKDRLVAYIEKSLLPTVRLIESAFDQLDWYNEGARSMVFTNNLGSSFEHLVGQNFRNKKIPVVSFQHGVVGLMKLYDYYGNRYGISSNSDYIVAYSDYEKKYLSTKLGVDAKTIFIAKSPKKQYSHLSQVWRFLVRAQWSLLGQHVVLYAPTQISDGITWPYDRRDGVYWKIQKELINEIFGKLDSTVIIKIHQKTISPKTREGVYQERRHPTEEMVIPQNISIRKCPRLDLSCFAGDVIIIDHATTTIQVVFRTKVPVIYIDLPSSPLQEDVANSMREAMFLVDANVTGWQWELTKLLTMAKRDMQYAWDKKADARRCWVADYLAGTNNSENFTLDL